MYSLIFRILCMVLVSVLAILAYIKIQEDEKCNKLGRTFVVFTIVILQLIWCHYTFFVYWNADEHREKFPEFFYTVCGKVTKQIETNETYGKYHDKLEHNEYLVVKFDNGYIERIKVSRDTYEKHEKGARICFDRTHYTTYYNSILLRIISGVIILLAGTIILIIYISKAH